jgi:hypothetical protein
MIEKDETEEEKEESFEEEEIRNRLGNKFLISHSAFKRV